MTPSTKAHQLKNDFGKLAEKEIIVLVITPRFRDFLNFVRDQKEENEKYHFVDSLKSIVGMQFHKVEKLYNYFHIKEIDEILDYIESH